MPRVQGRSRVRTPFVAILVVAALGLSMVPSAHADAAPAVPAPAPGPARLVSPAPPASSTTPTPPNTSPFPPGVPGDLRVTAVTSTSITLAWTASTPGCCEIEGYDIGFAVVYNDVPDHQAVGNVTTYTLSSRIFPATQYDIRVSARDGLGHNSASTPRITVVTPATDTGPDVTPPAAPTGLTVTNTPAGSALTWSASTDNVGVIGYDVYRYDGLYAQRIASVTGTSYTAQLGSSPTGFPLTVFVRARDAAGNVSLASNAVIGGASASPSAPPSIPPPAPSCRAGYLNDRQWTGGFLADLEVTNAAQAAVTGWTITLTFGGDQRVVRVWNAGFSQTGATLTLTNVRWNRVIPAGGSVEVGLQGRWRNSNAPPTAVSVNGAPCALG